MITAREKHLEFLLGGGVIILELFVDCDYLVVIILVY